ncbi:MAG TPA: TonB-dependent receptor [Vicinamibacterales bacterium]|nr:TonB-dependent receptor [Vicinamibacterales bacterium]
MIRATPHQGTIVALLSLSVLAASAAAQEVPATVIEEIVVTARKRVENLQEVPDSITAFNERMIQERRINRISDAMLVTPGVHMVSDQDAGTNIITVRGIGTNRNLPASVAFVVDGVVLPDSDAFTADLSDIERIEVLKGPQGGLYGRNAIAGAINLTSRRPTEDFSSDVKLGYSSGDTMDLFGAISGPVAGDRLLGRFAIRRLDTQGRITNTFTGDKLDHDENTRVSGRLIWTATDNLTLDLRGSYYDQDSGALWFSTADVLGTTGGRITKGMARINPNQDDPGFTDRTITDVALVAEYETGAGTITSITAYDDIDLLFGEDLDATPIAAITETRQDRDTRGISQELRFTSPAERRLRYIVGGYYQNTERDLNTRASLDYCFFFGVVCGTAPPFTLSGIRVPTQLNILSGEFDQQALFAQGSYDLTEALELTVALRYDRDEREQVDQLTSRTDEATFSKFQPKVSLAWKATDDVMLYATVAEGYKSGAFNPPPSPTQTFPLVVKQEGTTNFEVGMKSSWLDNMVQVNVSAYHTDYEDIQVFRLDLQTGGQVAINADKARIRGVELEMTARPAAGLELTAAYGYTDAKFTNFDGTGTFDGNRLPNTPEYTFNAGARYEHALANDFSFVTRLDYHLTGSIYFADENIGYQPTYRTVDAQLGFEKGRWSLTFWGENIFDERYVSSVFMRSISPAIYGRLGIDAFQPEPGATYGAEFRWRF